MTTDFREYTLMAPAYDDVAAEYQRIRCGLDAAATGDEVIAAVEAWDGLRRRLSTWSSLVNIRFHQDTRNEDYKNAREYCDELEPKLTNLAVDMKRRLLASQHREAIAKRFGRHAFDLWACDIASFDPAIEEDLVAQSKLIADYTALLASAKFQFRGETLTLPEIVKFSEHPNRGTRHAAAQLHWRWFGEHRETLDAIFDQLVRLRQRMAKKLQYENYIPLGYQRMQRVDYSQSDVERFRSGVREHIVPLASEIRRRQAQMLGVESLMAWDEAVHDPAGNPQPNGDHDWMIDRATNMFAQLGSGMDEFFARCARAT